MRRNRASATRNDLLREIYFFDSSVDERIKWLEILDQAYQALQGPMAFKAKQIPVTGKVITRTFQSRLPKFDRLYNAPDLFMRAQSAFKLWKRPLTVRMPEKPDLAHWTYPIPLRVPGRPNIYTLHDVVPLRLPYTTLDHKRRYLQLLHELDRKAEHFVTVSESSKRDLVDLVGIAPERITNTYQSVSIPDKYRLKPEDQVAREVEGLTGFDYKGYFLFWGSLEPKKNIGRLIEAYLSSQVDTPLVIVGAQAWKSEQELKLLGDTEYLLEQWGWWRMDGMGVPGYVSPAAAIMSQAMPMSSPKAYHVTDDMALAVDRVIARLIDRAPQAGDFVWLYYGAKWPALRIAREHQIGEAKVRETLKLAVGWVDSALERFRESA